MILRGWKDICFAAGGMHEDTARRLMREEGFPVEIVGGKPMSTSAAIESWVSARIEKHVKKKTGRSDPIEGRSDPTEPEMQFSG